MTKIGIRQQLWGYSVFVLSLILVLGGTSYYKSSQLLDQLEDVSQIQLPSVRSITLADMMHDGLRGIVYRSMLLGIEKKTSEFEDVRNENEEMSHDFNVYVTKLDNLKLKPETKSLLESTKPAVQKYLKISSEFVHLSTSGQVQIVQQRMHEFNDVFSELEEKLEKLGSNIEAESKKVHNEGTDVLHFSGIITALGFFFGMILAVLVTRNLVSTLNLAATQIQQSSEFVGTNSHQLEQASETFSQGAMEAASSLEQTVATLESISKLVQDNAQQAEKAYTVSDRCRHSALHGQEDIQQLIVAMNDISASSKQIEEIINVIDDIAFQTNLLALNAAVEAARAGEQGKGFAVVAEAVRSLAQRSASAAKDINHMINESVDKIQNGTAKVNRNQDALNEIVKQVEHVAEINRSISAASKEQAHSIEAISKAMETLDTATQKNAATSEEVASSSSEMNSQAIKLNELVRELKQSVLGRAA